MLNQTCLRRSPTGIQAETLEPQYRSTWALWDHSHWPMVELRSQEDVEVLMTAWGTLETH